MPQPPRTCFVVQGFGKKTDYTDGRILDLDASYAVIKEAVEAAGLECIRADEIVHSGTIDLPMYEQLLRADLVLADLSTYNVNAVFELGVRYGLRPAATIIVAESGFKNPFDVGHIAITPYKHLGEDIGRMEALRFKQVLVDRITQIVAGGVTDSPVYTFLQQLDPPREREIRALAAAAAAADDPFSPTRAPPSPPLSRSLSPPLPSPTTRGGPMPTGATAPVSRGAATESPKGSAGGDAAASSKWLLESALAKISPPPGQPSDFAGARTLLELLRAQRPNDPFVLQQLALATYKSGQPDPKTALLDARKLLLNLDPLSTNDPETLGLWGAVHKRLWDLDADPADLAASINAYSRGYQLKQDHYNGINFAMLLELRALRFARAGERDEAITDKVLARRVREELIALTEPRVAERAELPIDQRYWLLASLWEIHAGLGRADSALGWERAARALQPADWMLKSTELQVAGLRRTQAELASCLSRAG